MADRADGDLSMLDRRRLIAIALLFVIAQLLAGCDGEEPANLLEISRRRQCRANLNALATDQAMFRDTYGRWAAGQEELDQFVGRLRPLSCPVTGELYIYELKEDGYIISCPAGHGSIDTGGRCWTVENDL